MVDRFGLQAAIETKVVGHVGEIPPARRHVGSALTDFVKLKRAFDVVTFPRRHRRLAFIIHVELGEMEFLELRLRVERVDVTRATLHHQKDARLRSWSEMCLGFAVLIRRHIIRQQRSQRDTAKRSTESVECAATGNGGVEAEHDRCGWMLENLSGQSTTRAVPYATFLPFLSDLRASA